ncbi:MAG: hypothetical protein ABGZ53_00270, partial [Fuerstiella sp.]
YDAHQSIRFQSWVSLGAQHRDLTLRVRTPTQQIIDHFAKITAAEGDSPTSHRRELIYADRIAKLQNAPDTIDVALQVFRIGDLGISAIPFETFVEIGLELKDRSPFARTFTIELANGSYGYLPTPEQHELGGYETWLGTNFVERQASRKITETLLQMQQEIAAPPGQ